MYCTVVFNTMIMESIVLIPSCSILVGPYISSLLALLLCDVNFQVSFSTASRVGKRCPSIL